MASESIRQFREVKIEPGKMLTITSGLTGTAVKINAMNLNERENQILGRVCEIIENKLAGTSIEQSIRTIMNNTLFYSTNSQHVGAYSARRGNDPIIIINAKTFSATNNEFMITVLHELLHFITEPGDGNPASLYEAEHDLTCYRLLGIPVPHNHWAFTKYPHLKKELLTSSETGGKKND